MGALSEFERDLLVERTKAGLARARQNGAKMGRPAAVDAAQLAAIKAALGHNPNVSHVARTYGVSRGTVQRINKGVYKGVAA